MRYIMLREERVFRLKTWMSLQNRVESELGRQPAVAKVIE
jgi:hypothetical protein